MSSAPPPAWAVKNSIRRWTSSNGSWLAADARGHSFLARIIHDVTARDMLTAGQKRRILRSAQL